MGRALTAGDVLTEGANYIVIKGDDGTSDNDVVIDVNFKYDISRFNQWVISTTGGAVDVWPDLGSGEDVAAALSLFDLGGIDQNVTKIVTLVDRVYAFYGSYANINVKQAGATAAVNCYLRGWN